MKKIKTLLAVLMIFTMTFVLAACGSAGSNEASGMQMTEAESRSEEMLLQQQNLKKHLSITSLLQGKQQIQHPLTIQIFWWRISLRPEPQRVLLKESRRLPAETFTRSWRRIPIRMMI